MPTDANLPLAGVPTLHYFPIHVVDLRNSNSPPFIIDHVHEFTFIREIKVKLANQLKTIDLKSLQLFHPNNPLAHTSVELKDSQALHDLRIDRNGGVLQLSIRSSTLQVPVSSQHGHSSIPSSLLSSAVISPSELGTSGVYFVEDAIDRHRAAVFKPFDEEQGMPNNPKGYTKAALKENFKPGQGIIREYSAWILDYQNFCRVPQTRLVHLEDDHFKYRSSTGSYPKLGALQDFINNGEEIEGFGPSKFR